MLVVVVVIVGINKLGNKLVFVNNIQVNLRILIFHKTF
jgi:hypothetical protein